MATQEDIAVVYPIDLADLYGGGFANVMYFTPSEFVGSIDGNELNGSISNLSTIALELPDEININESHQWDSASSYVGMVNPGQKLESFKQIGGRFVRNFVSGAADKVGSLSGVGANAASTTAEFTTGKKLINPHTVIVYNDSQLRTMNFQFVFNPVSKEEAESINRIVKMFQWYSRASVEHRGIAEMAFPNYWKLATSSTSLNYLFEFPDSFDGDGL